MQGMLLTAAITPDNTPHGYNLTFAFPELLFIIVAAALYLRFRSRHMTQLSTRRPTAAGVGATATATAAAGTSPVNGDTTHGSTLHEGDPGADVGHESPAEESTEDGE